MSPTSYLAAPPRGGPRIVSISGWAGRSRVPRMAESPKRVAVIDVGTNSSRLLVADVEGRQVRKVERRSTVTRLGRGVDLSGRLAAEAIEDACAAIGSYLEAVRELGVERVEAIAT